MTATLRFEDKIAVLDLGEDENRFSPDWLGSVDKLLDQALSEGAHALVTTATGKFYSNGLDLDWLGANGDKAKWYVQQVQSLFARMLTFPMPTVAAINGHAFGAGAMLGIAHDYRVMRDDRGYYCFPEVDINIPFTEGMAALIQAKLSPASAIVAMTTGRRYGGSDAFRSRFGGLHRIRRCFDRQGHRNGCTDRPEECGHTGGNQVDDVRFSGHRSEHRRLEATDCVLAEPLPDRRQHFRDRGLRCSEPRRLH